MEIRIDEEKFKAMMKDALIEAIEDRKEIIYGIFSEVIEDIALSRAIDEGDESDSVDRQAIFSILRDQE